MGRKLLSKYQLYPLIHPLGCVLLLAAGLFSGCGGGEDETTRPSGDLALNLEGDSLEDDSLQGDNAQAIIPGSGEAAAPPPVLDNTNGNNALREISPRAVALWDQTRVVASTFASGQLFASEQPNGASAEAVTLDAFRANGLLSIRVLGNGDILERECGDLAYEDVTDFVENFKLGEGSPVDDLLLNPEFQQICPSPDVTYQTSTGADLRVEIACGDALFVLASTPISNDAQFDQGTLNVASAFGPQWEGREACFSRYEGVAALNTEAGKETLLVDELVLSATVDVDLGQGPLTLVFSKTGRTAFVPGFFDLGSKSADAVSAKVYLNRARRADESTTDAAQSGREFDVLAGMLELKQVSSQNVSGRFEMVLNDGDTWRGDFDLSF